MQELEKLQVILGGDSCDDPAVQGIPEGRRLQWVQVELADSFRPHTRGQRARQHHRPLVLTHQRPTLCLRERVPKEGRSKAECQRMKAVGKGEERDEMEVEEEYASASEEASEMEE